MKKKYIAPKIEIVKLTLKDVILSSPTEGDIPTQEATIPLEFGEGELD